jgi:hypothetical protein
MKKDYIWFTIIGLLIFSYILDRISPPIGLQATLRNPYQLLTADILSRFPLTAVSIAAKAISITGILTLSLSYIFKASLIKASILFVLAGLAQLYAIQQLAIRGTVTPIEWTLGIAYAGIATLLPTIIFLLQGIFSSAKTAIVKEIKPVRHDLRQPPTPDPTP